MPEYDFHTLTPIDFEDLTRDLLQASQGVVFQSFKIGRDLGVDLRYAADGVNRIVQCKHWRKSGYDALLRELGHEVKKIARMKPAPTRYFLTTSVELSNTNKEEMAKVLGLPTTQDILGRNDLNNLLGLHPEVETRHFKLWLPSTAILQRVLNNAEAMQSEFEYKRIRREVPRFVQTRAYEQAAEQLARDRVLVLSGLPGVGKSTIADFLVYEKVAEGFQPVIARNSFEEARRQHRDGVRQVFLYDDFLGATFLGEGGAALVRNEDRAITDFLNVIADDPDKLLILTTREHILTEALERSERLRHSSVRDHRYVVRVGVYTAEQRSLILYNHAYFNGLGTEHLTRLLAGDFFFKVIEHPKFSPRVVEWITSPRRVKSTPSQYQSFVLRLLDNPAEIWRHAYDEEISDAAKSALLTLHSLNGRVSHERMREAFEALHAARAARYGFTTAPDDYLRAMRVLNSAFVTITHSAVEFIDPSVRDLMNSILNDAPDNAVDILRGAVSMSQVAAVWAVASTRDGEHIQQRIDAVLPTVVDGVRRALNADLYLRADGMTGVFSPVIEERLTVLADMAASFGNPALVTLLAPTVERVIEVWRTDAPHTDQAIAAIRTLGEQLIAPLLEVQTLRRNLLSALATQTQADLEPAQLRRLLILQDQGWSEDERQSLRHMAERWREDMGDRLRACGSNYELERLAEILREVGDAIEVDLRSAIQKVEIEIEMAGEEDEPEPREGERPDPRYETDTAGRRAIQALFATLRPAQAEGDALSATETYL